MIVNLIEGRLEDILLEDIAEEDMHIGNITILN